MNVAVRPPVLAANRGELLRAHEARLYQILLALYGLGGFEAVQRAVTRQQRTLASELRAEIAREGWIA